MKVSFIPVKLRLPLKFGAEVIDSLKVVNVEFPAYGAVGKAQTPLSAAWAWPGEESFSFRENMMSEFCLFVADFYPVPESDPMTEGYTFLKSKHDCQADFLLFYIFLTFLFSFCEIHEYIRNGSFFQKSVGTTVGRPKTYTKY